MAMFFQAVVDGILAGMLYAVVAAGLSLIWGVMDVLNFAHGDFLMGAMYVSYWLGFLWKVDPLVSWAASGAFLFLFSILAYRIVIAPCIGGKSPMAPLLATFGLSMLLKNVCLNRFSPNFLLLSNTWMDGRKFELGGVVVPVPQLVTGIFSLAVLGTLAFVLARTRLGWAIQATAMDREASELMGINSEGIYLLVFGIGGAALGVAGGLMPSYLAVHPDVGSLFGLIAFVIVALGGFGSMAGTLLAALLIGLVESLAGLYIAPVFKYVAVFAIYLVVIMVRPKGLFGW